MGISFSEILLIFLVVLIFFGAESIPGFAKTLGRLVADFKKASEDVKRELNENLPVNDIKKDINDIRDNITGQVSDLKNDIRSGITNTTGDINKTISQDMMQPLQEAKESTLSNVKNIVNTFKNESSAVAETGSTGNQNISKEVNKDDASASANSATNHNTKQA